MALQTTASVSNPLKLSEVKTEFAYWVTSNNLRDFMYKGIGPSGPTYTNTTPPNNALNLTSFLGKEGGGDFYYAAGTFVVRYYWHLEEELSGPNYINPFYMFYWGGSNVVQINGDLPNGAADYYDVSTSGGMRYFRGKLEATTYSGTGDGSLRNRYYGISRIYL